MTVVARATAPGGGPAFAYAGLASPSQDALSLASRLARLPDLDSAALRDEWRRLRRAEPPRISRDLLVRAIAYGLQEREFGGLPKWARQSLTGSGPRPSPKKDLGRRPRDPGRRPRA